MSKYTMPILGCEIFSINTSPVAMSDAMLPDILTASEKQNLIQCQMFTRERIPVNKMEIIPDNKDYILINGTISYPKHLDTAEKLKNRFYGSQEEVDEEIIKRTTLEIEKAKAVAEFLSKNVSYLEEVLTEKYFE